MTTIGFDDLTPKDPRGRMVVVIFALEALSLKFYVLSIINRKLVHRRLRLKQEHDNESEEALLMASQPKKRKYLVCFGFKLKFFLNKLFWTLVGSVALLLLASFYFTLAEGWSFLDAFYFSTVIAATIGYGDMKIHSVAGECGVVFLASLGQLILSYTISEIQEQSVERVNKKLKEIKSDFVPLLPMSSKK